MSRIPITVCIIAKNEEKFIGECLSRLKPYGFEIIVTDTGSTDKTVEIAQKYADKVLHFKWVNDFSKARNFCAAHSSNEWILALDCDEHVVSIDIPKLVNQTKGQENNLGVLSLSNIIRDGNGEKEYMNTNVIRLYNKKYYQFVHPIHEQIFPYDAKMKKMSFHVSAEIIHYGYMLDQEELEKKQGRNLELLLVEEKKKPKDAYVQYQIGQSYYALQNFQDAVTHYEKAFENNQDFSYEYVRETVYWLALAYVRNGEEKKGLQFIENLSEKLTTARLTYCYALVLYYNDEYMKAQLYFLKVTMMKDFSELSADCKHCYEHIIELYEAMDDFKMADIFRNNLKKYISDVQKVVNI